MKTITLAGVPRRDQPETFVFGRVGVEDYASPGILVLPRSVSFSTAYAVNNHATNIPTFVHTITMEDGTTRLLAGRFVRQIGYVTIDPETNVARWVGGGAQR
jgi:hypothetical protein